MCLEHPSGVPTSINSALSNVIRYKHLNAEFQRIARRDKNAFFSDQCKEIEENNRMGKAREIKILNV